MRFLISSIIAVSVFTLPAHAAVDPCAQILEIANLATDLPAGLDVRFHFAAKINLLKYEPANYKTHYIKTSGQEAGLKIWNDRRGPHLTQVTRDFTAADAKLIFTLAHPPDEAIRLIIEVQEGYVFPIYEMGDPPNRVPTVSEAIGIIQVAESLNQTPEDLFTEFYDRLRKADSARTDHTHASIAEVIATYGL